MTGQRAAGSLGLGSSRARSTLGSSPPTSSTPTHTPLTVPLSTSVHYDRTVAVGDRRVGAGHDAGPSAPIRQRSSPAGPAPGRGIAALGPPAAPTPVAAAAAPSDASVASVATLPLAAADASAAAGTQPLPLPLPGRPRIQRRWRPAERGRLRQRRRPARPRPSWQTQAAHLRLVSHGSWRQLIPSTTTC